MTLNGVDLTGGTAIIEIDAIGGETSGLFTGGGVFGLPNTLQIERPNGFLPTVGDEFDIMNFNSLADSIDEVLGGDIGGGLHLTPMIDNGMLKLLAENN